MDTGLIELTITCTEILDESLKDAQYTRSFEAEIGSGRFESFDKLLQSVDMTREAGLAFIADLQEANSGNGHTSRPNLPAFTKIAELDEVTYRWEIGWLSSTNDTSNKSINELTNLGTLSTIDLTSTDSDLLSNDDLAKELLNSLAALNFGSLTANDEDKIKLIADSFDSDGNVDKTYENLTFAGGPLFNAASTLDQDLIIRAFSTVTSIDEREKTTSVSADGTKITLKFDDIPVNVTNNTDTRAQFAVTVDGASVAASDITNISSAGDSIILTLDNSAKVEDGDTLSVSYTGNGEYKILNSSDSELNLFEDRGSLVKELRDLLTSNREAIQELTVGVNQLYSLIT